MTARRAPFLWIKPVDDSAGQHFGARQVTMAAERGVARESLHEQVLVRAAECFDRYGIERTRMVDIAARAGVSRNALYRQFPNRKAIVDAVLLRHVEALVDVLQREITQQNSFPEAVLSGVISAIAIMRTNPEMLRLMYESAMGDVSRSLLRPSGTGLALATRLWKPVIDRGRERQEVRPDLNEGDFVEWLSTIVLNYAIRDDIPPVRIANLLRHNLLPAAVAGAERLVPSAAVI